MSLKAFHLFFIFVSIILSVGFGVWSVGDYSERKEMASLLMGIASFVVSVGLVGYLFWFIRKLRRISVFIVPLGTSIFAGLSFMPGSVMACPVCVGNPNSPLTQSANTATVFLLFIIGGVLFAFASLFISWIIRAKNLSSE